MTMVSGTGSPFGPGGHSGVRAGAHAGVHAGAVAVGPWIYGRWVQPPAQRRSRRTFYKFLDAAEGLLAHRQWHEVSVQEIVKKAEASVGAFYNRFADKAALLHCLDDRLAEECERTVSALIEEFEACPALVADAPAIMISLLIRLCHDHGGVIRALDLTAKMAKPAAGEFGLGPRFDAVLRQYAIFLCARLDGLQGRDPADVVAAFQDCFWLARERLIYRLDTLDGVQVHQMLLRHFGASLQG